MSAILMAVITYFGWGTGDAFGAIVTRKIGVAWALVGMVSIAVFFTFIKPIVAIIGWFWPIYLTSLVASRRMDRVEEA